MKTEEFSFELAVRLLSPRALVAMVQDLVEVENPAGQDMLKVCFREAVSKCGEAEFVRLLTSGTVRQ